MGINDAYRNSMYDAPMRVCSGRTKIQDPEPPGTAAPRRRPHTHARFVGLSETIAGAVRGRGIDFAAREQWSGLVSGYRVIARVMFGPPLATVLVQSHKGIGRDPEQDSSLELQGLESERDRIPRGAVFDRKGVSRCSGSACSTHGFGRPAGPTDSSARLTNTRPVAGL